jgi:cytochrome c oxidase cbb3-type subunit 3
MSRASCILAYTLLLAACEREERSFRLDPRAAGELNTIALSPAGQGGAPPLAVSTPGHRYEQNAYHLSEGKRLYVWFNCDGCHADGGGAIGPALIDERWRYGADLTDIAASIRDGRPNGMPAFRDRIPAEQVWELAAYVQALGAQTASSGAPSRSDAMQSRPGENRAPAMASGSSSPDRVPPSER